jgi:AAA15 family ATPase/GTPase
MLKSLKIKNFRGFESIELKQLGQVNLLVGENNSGKTSILEAIQLLLSRVDLEPTSASMIARGEYLTKFLGDVKTDLREIDIAHLFYGHKARLHNLLEIEGRHDDCSEKVIMSIHELLFDNNPRQFGELPGFFDAGSLELKLQWSVQNLDQEPLEIQNRSFPLEIDSHLPLGHIRRVRKESNYPSMKTQMISATNVSFDEIFRLFENIQLTPAEELVNQALQVIEPKCERIAGKPTHNRFEVKLSDQDQPIPLGSMGDGMSRILRLALGLANAKGGVLLIDEIDTGLHFMAMTGMWKMLWEACNKLDIQIFATTHSRDCWESLAEVAEWAGVQDDEILLHRIEQGKKSSVIFDAQQISIAMEERLEVR